MNILDEVIPGDIDIEALKSAVAIDVTRLVDECAIHPYLYAQACKLSVMARSEMRHAKSLYEIAKVEVEWVVRKNPEEYIQGKTTETAITSAVNAQDIVQEAYETFLSAQKNADSAQALIDVLDQRRSMLNNETQMLVSQYYNESPLKISRSASERFEDEVKRKRESTQSEPI